MGASPKMPPIPGADLKGVYHLTSLNDAAAVAQEIKAVERQGLREGARPSELGIGFRR